MKTSIFCILISLSSFTSFSQISDCAEIIKAILPNGVYEYTNTIIDEKFYQSIINYYKEHSFQSYAESKRTSANLTVPIEDVLVGFGFNNDETSYQKFISDIDNYFNKYTDYETHVQKSWSRINTKAISLIHCLSNPDRVGIRGVKIYTEDPNVIIIRFFYNGNYDNSPNLATISINNSTENLKINTNLNKFIIKKGSFNDLIITRTNNKFAIISFNSNVPNADENVSLTYSMANLQELKKMISQIHIDNGKINTQATTYGANYGAATVDNDWSNNNAFHDVPSEYGPSYNNRKSITKTFVRKDSTMDNYTFTFNMTNSFYGLCDAFDSNNQSGGSAMPLYETEVRLPYISDSIRWNVNLSCQTTTSTTIRYDGYTNNPN